MATTTHTDTAPKIYVGTYGKYAAGSIAGAWLDLADYSDKDEFEAACQALHGPGEHEFMFQDHEGIPARFISESHLAANVWTDWVDLDDDDKELLSVYLDNVNQDGDLDEAREAFRGKYESPADFAEELAIECGDLANVPEFYRNHIDWVGIAREYEQGDFTFVDQGYHDTWVFSN